MRAARFAILAIAVFGVVLATSAAAAPPGAPGRLRGFELRTNEVPTHTFSRTPAFAWSPVRGASCYEFELATSRSFDGSSVFWSNVACRRGIGQVLPCGNDHRSGIRRPEVRQRRRRDLS